MYVPPKNVSMYDPPTPTSLCVSINTIGAPTIHPPPSSVSPRVKTGLTVYKIDNSKDQCYLITEPVIAKNPRRIYSKHAIAPEI